MAEAALAGLVGCIVGALAPMTTVRLLARRSIGASKPSPCAIAVTACAVAIAYATLVALEGLTLWTIEMMALLAILAICSLTDLLAWVIPNECMVTCVVLHACYLLLVGVTAGWQLASSLLIDSLISAVVVAVPLIALILIMDGVLGSQSMGGGDLKLFAVGALVFGWQRSILLILLACLLGAVFGLAYGRRRSDADATHKVGFPFGPSIACASWITALFGSELVSWYISMLV